MATVTSISSEGRVRSMDVEKVIDCLQADKEYLTDMKICDGEEMDVAIKALEKQIPKKPNIEGDGYADGQLVYDTWICPCCENHYEIDYDNYDYCPNCGQHIDRSELN